MICQKHKNMIKNETQNLLPCKFCVEGDCDLEDVIIVKTEKIDEIIEILMPVAKEFGNASRAGRAIEILQELKKGD